MKNILKKIIEKIKKYFGIYSPSLLEIEHGKKELSSAVNELERQRIESDIAKGRKSFTWYEIFNWRTDKTREK